MINLPDRLVALRAELADLFPIEEPEVTDQMFALAASLLYNMPKRLTRIRKLYTRMIEIHLDDGDWVNALRDEDLWRPAPKVC